MKLIVSTDAEQDLEDITSYSFEQWGLEQALLYADAIETTFQKLLETPYLGLVCVLSQTMDAPRHMR